MLLSKRGLWRNLYDSRRHRTALRERGITPRSAKTQYQPRLGLGKGRWVIERTISWLHRHRRLEYERSPASGERCAILTT